MSIIKVFLFLFILSILGVEGRALRERRQTGASQLGQGVSTVLSNGYNVIRDHVVPAVGSTVNQISQNWDRYREGFNQGFNQIGQGLDHYKQKFSQGINQFTQGWNQFTQNVNPQYPPHVNNKNYPYNQYGYNNQQYPYPMNSNYNVPPNMNQNYDGRQGNPYPGNNYFNSYGQPRGNSPYYTSNTGGQWYPNFGGQQRSNGAIPPMYVNQRPSSRRR